MREAEGFSPRMSERDLSRAGLVLREEAGGGALQVGPPEVTHFSAPRRNRRPPKVRLVPGQWVRWQINYRYGNQGGPWAYRLETFNVAYGAAPADVFLGTPTRSVDERGFLR
ncbi:hypothetical protein [Streptomyces sp. NPDC008001]|uniref:hypothetical protein n=1 Tax=Streptomyces sp. NPDC008001 TaxID=3364804 RepID=UPI0036EE006C